MSSVYLLFYTVYRSGNRIKNNITPYRESSIIQLIELNLKSRGLHFCKVL